MKRIVVTALWFYSFWYLGSMIANVAGVPDLLGPIFGVAAGVLIGLDPRHKLWTRQVRTAPAARVPATA